MALGWSRPGLPLLSNLAGPVQYFKAATLDAWRNKVAADLCGREGFRGGPLLDVYGSLQLLISSHVRDRDKALLRSVMVGCVWNGFLLGRVKGPPVPCRFCGAPDGDGHLFGECTFPPLVEVRENPEFHDLVREDKAHWPRCLLWHGWLPMLSGVSGACPWAADPSQSAVHLVEVALGRYPSRSSSSHRCASSSALINRMEMTTSCDDVSQRWVCESSTRESDRNLRSVVVNVPCGKEKKWLSRRMTCKKWSQTVWWTQVWTELLTQARPRQVRTGGSIFTSTQTQVELRLLYPHSRMT